MSVYLKSVIEIKYVKFKVTQVGSKNLVFLAVST